MEFKDLNDNFFNRLKGIPEYVNKINYDETLEA
jgi:hypothetical protein